MTLPRIASQAAACDGKSTYTRMSVAANSAKWLSRNVDEAFKAYKCRHCGMYHVGSTDDHRRPGKPKFQEQDYGYEEP